MANAGWVGNQPVSKNQTGISWDLRFTLKYQSNITVNRQSSGLWDEDSRIVWGLV